MEDAGGVLSNLAGSAGAGQDSPRSRKIAILGFGRTVKDCPWRDESWELWAMNGFWRAAEKDFGILAAEERYSLWLDLHTIEYTREYGKRAGFGDAQERWLEKPHPFPVFMLEESPTFPSVQRFPIELLIESVGRDYFTSTVAYALASALALALDGIVAEVGLWGIDLTHDTEYADQRSCAEYWIGRLEAAGVKVTIHQDSALLRQQFRYGYEDENPVVREMRRSLQEHAEGLARAIEKNTAEIDRLTKQVHTDDGARQQALQSLGRLHVWARGGAI